MIPKERAGLWQSFFDERCPSDLFRQVKKVAQNEVFKYTMDVHILRKTALNDTAAKR